MLYPAPLRDLLIETAATGLYRAKWTDEIHEEWIAALLATRSDLSRSQLERTRALMNAAVPDCLVDSYQDLIPVLTLPDDRDRHVLAAAIRARCDAIVTYNVKDFPRAVAEKYDLDIQHPDDFLHNQFSLDTAAVVIAAKQCRSRLRRPPKTAAEYLEILESQSLPRLVSELLKFSEII